MKILITRSASKQLLKIPHKSQSQIEQKIELLSSPSSSHKTRKLSGRPGWRLRVDDYRIIYSENKKTHTITILSVQHRKDAYRHPH